MHASDKNKSCPELMDRIMELDHAGVVSRINLSAVRGHFAFAKALILDSSYHYFIAAWNSWRLLTPPFPSLLASMPRAAARAAAIVVM